MYGNKGKGIRQARDRGTTEGLVHQWNKEMRPYLRIWAGLDSKNTCECESLLSLLLYWKENKKVVVYT